MSSYRVERGSKISVRARSSVHDTDTVWDRVAGTIEVEAGAVEGASGAVTVDMALYRAHRNPEAAAELGRVAKAGGTPAQLCTARYHQADSWWKERSRTRSAPLFDEAIELCKKAGNVDLEVKAAYQAGRSYDRLDDKDAAVARFNLITAHDHSYADDAVLRAAEQFREHGDDATYVTMRDRIEREVAGRELDVKAGRGGINDIEFAAQYLRLLHGWQHPGVRATGTCAALEYARDHELAAPDLCERLLEGYRFLRKLELRIRIVHDRSERRLPQRADEREHLARRM